MEVIILAGGLGTRLRSTVEDKPKCLAPIAGVPFLQHLFVLLSRYHISRVVLSLGYLSGQVLDWLASEAGGRFSFEVRYVIEDEPLGTGGAIKKALTLTSERDVIVLNGDTFYDVDLDALMRTHISHGAPITLTLKPMRDFDRYGAVVTDVPCGPNDAAAWAKVVAFREKCHCESGLINGGVNIIRTDAGLFEDKGERFSFEKDVLEPQCLAGNIRAITRYGYFCDIGVREDYFRCQTEIPIISSGHRSICNLDLDSYDTIILDRDGVINRYLVGDYVRCWDEFEFLPGVKETLARWTSLGKKIFVCTNQRGITKGLMTEESLLDIHMRMCDAVSRSGGCIEKVYYCKAMTCDDVRRKPGRGMFDDILRDYPDVRPEKCVMVGDSDCDEGFARNSGIDFRRV